MVTRSQRAPGALERVREPLNIEWNPNDARQRRGDFPVYRARHKTAASETRRLLELRRDLRLATTHPWRRNPVLNKALERFRTQLTVEDGRLAFEHQRGFAGDLFGVTLDAIRDGTWRRLKACPDCEWMFNDHSRNGGNRWCVMNARTRGGRWCGTLAKVRAFRKRQSRVQR
jgi:predicted RNA-binding Zn ribbon-like protein